MDIKVTVDIDSVVKLTATVLRQLPYAANAAITRTAKEAVAGAQREASEHLQIRKNFILRRIRILQYSRVGNLTAVIGVDQKVQGSPLILELPRARPERREEPTHGSGIAIPLTGSPARPSFPQTVPTSLRYKNLRIANRKGRKSTFIVPGIGVFERIGAGGPQVGQGFEEAGHRRSERYRRDLFVQAVGAAPDRTCSFAQ